MIVDSLWEIKEQILAGQHLSYQYRFPNVTESVPPLKDSVSRCQDSYNRINQARELLRQQDLNIFIQNYERFVKLFFSTGKDPDNVVVNYIIDNFADRLDRDFCELYGGLIYWFKSDLDFYSVNCFIAAQREYGEVEENGLTLKLENQGTESAAVVVDRLIYPHLFQPLDLPDTLDSTNILTVIDIIFPFKSVYFGRELKGLQFGEKIQSQINELKLQITRQQLTINQQQEIINQLKGDH